jgi:hypothetical protein
MATQILTSDQSSQLVGNQGDIVLIEDDVVLSFTGDALVANGDVNATIEGSVVGGYNGVRLDEDDNIVTVASEGSVTGENVSELLNFRTITQLPITVL